MANKQSHSRGRSSRNSTKQQRRSDGKVGARTQQAQSSTASATPDEAGGKLSELRDTVSKRAGEEIDQVKRALHDAQGKAERVVKRTGENAMSVVKDNPWPIAVTAIGLAWLTSSLLVGSSRSTKSETSTSDSTQLQRAAQTMRRVGRDVMRRGHEVQVQSRTLVEENPVLAGVVLLGAGALVALLLPATRRESEWFGNARDQIMDSARGMARRALDKVESVAHSVTAVGDSVGESDPQTRH